jgi:hypothetical protein
MTVHKTIPLMLLVLAACQKDNGDLAACGADELQELVGQSPEMMGMMDIPMDARMLGPDDVATTDFVPDRLNISYDEDGVVTRVWCG